jgi:hypothetical protein
MTLRRLGFVLGFVFLLFPAVTRADAHRAGFMAGGSDLRASSFWGFHTTADYVFADISKPGWHKYLTLIGDFSVHSGSHDSDSDKTKAGFAGVGLRFAMSDDSPIVGGIHVLGGAVSGDDSNKTLGFGALVEIAPWRAKKPMNVGFRVQWDYLNRAGDQNYNRITIGGVIRLKDK